MSEVATVAGRLGALAIVPRRPTVQRLAPLGESASQRLRGAVIPSHSAECLSRALSSIPIYGRSWTRDRDAQSPLAKADAFTAVARQTLSRSAAATANMCSLLSPILRRLRTHERVYAAQDVVLLQATAVSVAVIAQDMRDAMWHVQRTAVQVTQELDARLSQAAASAGAADRWQQSVRVASLCVAAPSFAAAVLAAVWNTARPGLALAMALASASLAICGTIAPVLAQWHCERTEKALPPRAELQAVHVETSRVRYPLHLIFHWWKRMYGQLAAMISWSVDTVEAEQDLEQVVADLDAYTHEMTSILYAIESDFKDQQIDDTNDMV